MVSRLSIEVAGVKLQNPTMLAAGILGFSGPILKRVGETGAGAVVTKSIGLTPRYGYANPTVIQLDCGLLNAVGLSNPGISNFIEEIRIAAEGKVPVIVSVFGFSVEEYMTVCEGAEDAGAEAVELNVSCPHVEKTGSEIGQDPELVAKIVECCKGSLRIPVFVKLSPNVNDIVKVAEAAVNAGADAVTAINTLRAMAIDVETMRPILANKIGGLSGPAIKPIAVRCVYEISKKLSVPVIGCGGIEDWKDAVEFLLAGASAVQIGSALVGQDLTVFKSVTKGIEDYLTKKGFKSISEIVGLSHKF